MSQLWSVTANNGQYSPSPRYFYEKYFYAANLPPSLLAPEATIKVSGRGNLDHEQFVTSSISHTLRTKTDLWPVCVVRNKEFLIYSDIS